MILINFNFQSSCLTSTKLRYLIIIFIFCLRCHSQTAINTIESIQHQKKRISKNVKWSTSLTSPTKCSKFVLRYKEIITHRCAVNLTVTKLQPIRNICRTFMKVVRLRCLWRVCSIFFYVKLSQRNFLCLLRMT